MARAAGVKKSPYQNSAQMQPQSAKAKTFARRKKITPRRLGMGRMYCFASATAAERRTHPSRCTVQSSVDDRDAAAELVVERLSAEIEQGQHAIRRALDARSGVRRVAGNGCFAGGSETNDTATGATGTSEIAISTGADGPESNGLCIARTYVGCRPGQQIAGQLVCRLQRRYAARAL